MMASDGLTWSGGFFRRSGETGSLLRVELTLRPIAGFKGKSSDGGDPDDAPRPVALTLSDDARLLPLSLTVQVFFLPLVVRLDHLCTTAAPCPGPDPASWHASRAPIAPVAIGQRSAVAQRQ